MKIIDAHCDVLSKLAANPQLQFDKDPPEQELRAALPRLEQGGVKLQYFAIYISEKVGQPNFHHILEQIDLFYRKIAGHPRIRFVKSGKDVKKVFHGNEIGALLTLEGADGLCGNELYLRTLFHLGVRLLGITWNYANWAADGIMEPRKGGFTRLGRKLIAECNQLGILMDISHLSERGFWELAEQTTKPFVASHSNAAAICPHPRNLSDSQIKVLIKMHGMIGLTFVPWFIDKDAPVSSDGLLRHIDHLLSLGGARQIGFGSDFDGFEGILEGLAHSGNFDNLINQLLKRYKQADVEDMLWRNWKRFLITQLPE